MCVTFYLQKKVLHFFKSFLIKIIGELQNQYQVPLGKLLDPFIIKDAEFLPNKWAFNLPYATDS